MYFPISLLLSHFTDNNLIQLPTMLAKEFVYLRYTVPCVFTHSQFCYYFKSRHQQAGRNHKICQHCLCTTLDSLRVIFSKNPLIEFSSPSLLGLQKIISCMVSYIFCPSTLECTFACGNAGRFFVYFLEN